MEIAISVPAFVTSAKTGMRLLAKTVSDSERQIIVLIIYAFVCGVISLLGTLANITNFIIFYKQGLNTTINISFFAMAVSDLCSLIIQQWFNTFVNPLFENSDTPMLHTDVQYITGGTPREMFARITCLITTCITAERCLCIAFPLHIKQMITCKRLHKLGQKGNWRKEANIQQEKAISSRDRTTITMVVPITSILIACYTPAVLLCLTTFCEPEFSVGGKFYNVYYSIWAFTVLFESINSSVNILLYFKMSTNYRRSFREMFIRQESKVSRNTGTV